MKNIYEDDPKRVVENEVEISEFTLTVVDDASKVAVKNNYDDDAYKVIENEVKISEFTRTVDDDASKVAVKNDYDDDDPNKSY